MKRGSILLLAFLLTVTCVRSQERMNLDKTDWQVLMDRLSGEFSNEIQASKDPDYLPVSLKVAQVWKGRKDGYWIYWEEALIGTVDEPYLQKIFHFTQADDQSIQGKMYDLPSPLKYAGAAENPAILNKLPVDSLKDLNNCSIFIYKNKEGDFLGSTKGKGCISYKSGSTYVSMELHIKPNELIKWEKGWGSAGKQVWGNVKGGYQFVRVQKD